MTSQESQVSLCPWKFFLYNGLSLSDRQAPFSGSWENSPQKNKKEAVKLLDIIDPMYVLPHIHAPGSPLRKNWEGNSSVALETHFDKEGPLTVEMVGRVAFSKETQL